MKAKLIFSLILSQTLFSLNAYLDFSNQVVSQQALVGKSLLGANFTGATLNQIKFSKQSLEGANFNQANLNGVVFDNCNLSRAKFNGAILNQVQFSGPKDGLLLADAVFDSATIKNCSGLVGLLDSTQQVLSASYFLNDQFIDNNNKFTTIPVSFHPVFVSFKNSKFIDTSDLLNNKSFADVKLLEAYDFTGASFSGDKMSFSRTEFGAKVVMVNTKFEGPKTNFVMEAINVAPVGSYDNNKQGLIFFENIINGTNFTGAQFYNVNFSYLRAVQINLRKAVFNNCKMLTCFITGDLACTNFDGCIVKSNDFTNAKMTGSDLLKWIEKDADGNFSTNIFSPGLTYDAPSNLDRLECLAN
jgi:uncharacterized protein YjbI with pentapeptide repeats